MPASPSSSAAQPPRQLVGERRQRLRRDLVLARQPAEREQPLLDPLELARVAVEVGEHRLDRAARPRRARPAPGRARRAPGRARPRPAAPPPPASAAPAAAAPRRPRAPAPRRRGRRPRRCARRRGAAAAGRRAPAPRPAAGRARRARPTACASEVPVARRRLQRARAPPRAPAPPRRAPPRRRGPARAPPRPRRRRRAAPGGRAASSSPRSSLLAVQLDQRVGERPQRLGRDPPVVDPGLAPAVGGRGAAQDQLVAGGQARLLEQRPRRVAGPAAGTPATPRPRSAPARTSPPRPRQPSTKPRQSSRIDLPAPVSPVSTLRPGRKRSSARLDQQHVADRERLRASRPGSAPLPRHDLAVGLVQPAVADVGRRSPRPVSSA